MITVALGTTKALIETKSGKKRDGGEWEKKTFLFEVSSSEQPQVTSLITADLFSGDGPVVRMPAVGSKVRLVLSISSTQYNGKWFLRCLVVNFEEIPPVCDEYDDSGI
jgi:hypothetical protein